MREGFATVVSEPDIHSRAMGATGVLRMELADTLRECGVAGECIDIRELEMDAFESIFRLARPGDFVVFLCGVGNRAAIWERIRAVTQACRGGTTALQEPSFTSSLQ